MVHAAHALVGMDKTMTVSIPHGHVARTGLAGRNDYHLKQLKKMLKGALG
jgi:hypothetical protein